MVFCSKRIGVPRNYTSQQFLLPLAHYSTACTVTKSMILGNLFASIISNPLALGVCEVWIIVASHLCQCHSYESLVLICLVTFVHNDVARSIVLCRMW